MADSRLSFSQCFHRFQLKAAFVCATALAGSAALLAPAQAQAGWRSRSTGQEVVLRARKPDTCVNLAAPDISKDPETQRIFDVLSTLPLTGAPIVRTVQDPAYKMQLCKVDTIPEQFAAMYTGQEYRLLVPADGSAAPTSLAHEAYHAYKDIIGGDANTESGFTDQDLAFSVLLEEATAQAYELMVLREAAFYHPENYAAFLTEQGASSTPAYFDEAFNEAYALTEGKPENERRALSLQYAGTVTVDILLMGVNDAWSAVYRDEALSFVAANDSPDAGSSRRYRTKRAERLRLTGQVGELNITPARFLDTKADAEILRTLDDTGIEVVRVPKGKTRSEAGYANTR